MWYWRGDRYKVENDGKAVKDCVSSERRIWLTHNMWQDFCRCGPVEYRCAGYEVINTWGYTAVSVLLWLGSLLLVNVLKHRFAKGSRKAWDFLGGADKPEWHGFCVPFIDSAAIVLSICFWRIVDMSIKSKIKNKIPDSMIERMQRLRSRHALNKYAKTESKRFASSYAVPASYSVPQLESRLAFYVHQVEKGFSFETYGYGRGA